MKLRRVVSWAAAMAVLMSVFAAYLQPEMAFSVANWVWSCF
jgi:hypothetical protein